MSIETVREYGDILRATLKGKGPSQEVWSRLASETSKTVLEERAWLSNTTFVALAQIRFDPDTDDQEIADWVEEAADSLGEAGQTMPTREAEAVLRMGIGDFRLSMKLGLTTGAMYPVMMQLILMLAWDLELTDEEVDELLDELVAAAEQVIVTKGRLGIHDFPPITASS